MRRKVNEKATERIECGYRTSGELAPTGWSVAWEAASDTPEVARKKKMVHTERDEHFVFWPEHGKPAHNTKRMSNVNVFFGTSGRRLVNRHEPEVNSATANVPNGTSNEERRRAKNEEKVHIQQGRRFERCAFTTKFEHALQLPV